MPTDEYSAIGSGGKLKLKGSKVSDGRVEKKKKKKSKLKTNKDKEGGQSEVHQNVEETGATTTTVLPSDDGTSRAISKERDEGVSPLGEEGGQQPPKTEAERKYEETRRKRLQERLKREGIKTHKERVEELNKYLSKLTEHHDMPKIGPG